VRFGKEEGKEQIKIDYEKGNRSWILTRREKGSRSEYALVTSLNYKRYLFPQLDEANHMFPCST
jgi:hypothetical protein